MKHTTMTLDKAQGIVAGVVSGRKRLGKQYSPPWIMDDVLDALVIVHENGNLDATPKDEVTKLRRQLAACQNREKARLNKGLPSITDVARREESPDPVGIQIDMFEVPDSESTLEA